MFSKNNLLYIIALAIGLLSVNICFAQETQDSVLAMPQATANNNSQAAQAYEEDPTELYNKKNYDQAAQIYEQLLVSEGPHSGYYYNLGNCYYKLKQWGKAILNYERALRLDPLDNDAKRNLRMAQLQTIDKVTDSNTYLEKLWHSWSYILPLMMLNIMAMIFFFVGVFFFVMFLVGRRSVQKRYFFYISIVFIAFCVLLNLMASHQKNYYDDSRNDAVVMEREVGVRSTPDQSGTLLFNLHEGTLVKITGEPLSGWYPITLGDGKEGWISGNGIERVMKSDIDD